MEKHSNEEFMWNAVALASSGALETKIAIYVHQTNGNGPSDRLTTYQVNLSGPEPTIRVLEAPRRGICNTQWHRQSSNRGTVYNCRFK